MSEITKRDLTGGEVAGAGLYDELMRTSSSHLEAEFKGGRIQGKEYSTAYIGMMQANLQTALQFVLQKDLTNQQLLLAQEQLAQAVKQTELLELQKTQASIANDTAQYNLDTVMPKQTEILEQNLLQAAEQVKLLTAQLAQVNAQTALTTSQETLVQEQVATERTNTTNPTGGMKKIAYDKTQAEISVLDQKKLTEQKQTVGTVEDTSGLIGYEMTLKDKQASSFDRDAEQKACKIYSDIFSVMYSTEAEGLQNQAWGFGSDESFSVISKLLDGVGGKAPDVSSGT